MNGAHNNVIFDFDFIFDKEVALFLKYIQPSYPDVTVDEFIYHRVYDDRNINPLTRYLDESISENYFKFLTSDESLYETSINCADVLNMVVEYTKSEYVTVTIAYKHEVEKEIIEKMFGNEVKTIKKSISSPIELTTYDTIYVPNYMYFQFYDFTDKERMNIYIYGNRCSFHDEEKLTLVIEYLALGLKNDIYAIPVYQFEENKGDNND